MADENTIIEGTVKFRDGKKWKSRWCVMRKLSPVADCVHLQLYRDARARWAAARSKASLSLQHFLGAESGFTLDKHSNTLALVCRDFVAVLAFETRERLIQWQVKVNAHLGTARKYAVMVGSGRAAGGPARLLLLRGGVALTAGTPPRLLALWDLHHLRRYGVVDGRFCFEGGSHCGKGEGLQVLITDQARDIERDFDLASQGRLSPGRRPTRPGNDEGGEGAPLPLRPRPAADASPCWPSAEGAPAPGPGDTASVGGACGAAAAWAGAVSLQRCSSCMSKLGAMSRSSTGALTPAAKPFSPAWTMQALAEAALGDGAEAGAPPRPPRPPPCRCARPGAGDERPRAGPYENYDVPRLPSAEVDGEYYDTPKRLRERLDDEPFRMTRSSTTDSLVLKKPCGCLLRVGRRPRRPTVVDADEDARPAACPCRRVTDWANGWIGLPAGRRGAASCDDLAPTPERAAPARADGDALYATVDLARKTRRRPRDGAPVETDDGPLADYENLSFALSLERYENARGLLRRAGVTQDELDALAASLRGGCARAPRPADAYLAMRPGAGAGAGAGAGYAAMRPAARVRSRSADSPRPAPARAAGPAGGGGPAAGEAEADALELSGALSEGSEGRAAAAGNRDSSSSNDSGVSSWSRRAARPRRPPAARSRSSDWAAAAAAPAPPAAAPKSSSAEAAVPLLPPAAAPPRAGVVDAHSTSSGTSDMSDYIETLSLCSSHSSSDAPVTLRVVRQTTSTLRPRSGKEYQNLDPRLTSVYRAHPRPCSDLP